MEDIKRFVGDRIRELRKKKGLSQEKLGSKAKLHYTYIGSVERGEKNVSVESLAKIAKGLGVNTGEIFHVPRISMSVDKLRVAVINEINKSDPEILKIVSGLITELNSVKTKLNHKRVKMHPCHGKR